MMSLISKTIKSVFLFGLVCMFMQSACAESYEQITARLRARVLPITGGYTFEQYVKISPDDKETLGSTGVFYISKKPFTDADYKVLKRHKHGDIAVNWDMMAASYVHDRIADVCLAAKPAAKGQAGSFGASTPLIISSAFEKDGGVWFRVAVWSDFWDDLQLKKSNGVITITETGAEQGWGFSSSRFLVHPDKKVTFQSCINYAQN